jgi:hypothetical protein
MKKLAITVLVVLFPLVAVAGLFSQDKQSTYSVEIKMDYDDITGPELMKVLALLKKNPKAEVTVKIKKVGGEVWEKEKPKQKESTGEFGTSMNSGGE